MSGRIRSNRYVTPPNSPLLRRTFLLLWAVDTITAVFLILVPYAVELNPVTVFFYTLFGIPGIVLAACCYVALVIIVGNFLPNPSDVVFVAALVALYVLFVFNNVILLLFEWAPFGLDTGTWRPP
ncbi:hypothetical protein [Natrialbaceae archaeon AArc-T1-2]|uniref:hypothetical protein n=1 Tax=Natrialbaceae archaeon AArc-T1-2 TaxID=3053904 RepID=UPI00255AC598|nr:hypothetical protein [Natrialbaceae archaeon AArc-T1-2]WIV67971.1 hypothetical protein QQ977_04360 [Natrialbaceae archaeon AArc-T1-2]